MTRTDITDVINRWAKTQKNLVYYGARAINAYLPVKKQVDTLDYDMFTPDPRKSSGKLMSYLKGRGFKQVQSAPAMHPGTIHVFVNGDNVADFTKPEQCIPFIEAVGVKVPTIEWLYSQLYITLTNPEHKWRWAKDRSRLNLLQGSRLKYKSKQDKYKCMDSKGVQSV
jgi:hypothetical protein